jgi:hypothetical protein
MVALVNGAQTTLGADIASGATTITVASGNGAMFPSGDFTITLDDRTHQEVIYVPTGGRSGDTFSNCVRAYESYGGAATAYAFVAATPTTLAQTVTAATMNRQFAGGTMTQYSNFLGADVTFSIANTFFDGPALTLAPGTWLLSGQVTASCDGGTQGFTAKLWDGTSTFATASAANPFSGYAVPMPLMAVVSPTVATTYKISVCQDSAVASRIKCQPRSNPAGNNASYLIAMLLTSGGSSSAYAPSEQYAVVVDQKTAGTDGGTFNSGAWQRRDLNTVLANTGNWLTVSGNQITLPAGTYRTDILAPASAAGRHQARLQNVTSGTTLLVGTDAGASTGTGASAVISQSRINGRFTLTATSTLEVQHQCGTGKASDGFGNAAGGAFTVAYEVYTVAQFWLEQQNLAPNGSKLLLDFRPTTDLVNGQSISATTWTDVPGTTQTFTIDDGNALVEIAWGGFVYMNGSSLGVCSSRFVIDPAGANIIRYLGALIDSSERNNVMAGAPPVSVAAAALGTGTHTVKLQVYAVTSGFLLYCRPATNPNTEFVTCQVRQVPQATTTLSPAVANGTKILLNYTDTTDRSSTALSSSVWTDVPGTTQNFTVDDPNAIVELSAFDQIKVVASSYGPGATRFLIDGNPVGDYGIVQCNSGGYQTNVLTGGTPIPVAGLSVGVHAVKIQVNLGGGGTLYQRYSTSPDEHCGIRILQRPQVQATPVGGTAGDKLLLNYTETADKFSGSQMTIGTWYDLLTTQTFVVDDASATIEVVVSGNVLAGYNNSSASPRTQLVIDATGYRLGSQKTDGLSWGNPFAGVGPVPITGLAVGSHTLKVQVTSDAGAGASAAGIYAQFATNPNRDFLQVRVWQRPTIYRGGSVPSVQVGLAASKTPAQSAGNWSAALSWDVANWNTDNLWSAANPTRLTCQTPGKYLAMANLQAANATLELWLVKNGVTATHIADSAYQQYQLLSTVVDLSVGDYLELYGYNSNSGSNTINQTAVMSLTRIGDAALGGPVKFAEVGPLTSTAASVTLPVSGSLPQNYRNIRVTGQARGDTAATSVVINLQFNGDTGSNYDYMEMAFQGSTSVAQNYGGTSSRVGIVTAASSPANHAGELEITVPNYSGTTFYKNVVSRSGEAQALSSTNYYLRETRSTWHSTSAITSLTLTPVAGNFVAGSVFTLYLDP